MTEGARKSRGRLCPCGSGRLKRTCNPGAPALVPCAGFEGNGCRRLIHYTSNRVLRCEECARLQARKMARERKRRQRDRERELEQPAELYGVELALQGAVAS